MRRSYRLVPKLCLGTPLQAKLSLALFSFPSTTWERENLDAIKTATVAEIAGLPGFNQKIAEVLKEWLAGAGQGT